MAILTSGLLWRLSKALCCTYFTFYSNFKRGLLSPDQIKHTDKTAVDMKVAFPSLLNISVITTFQNAVEETALLKAKFLRRNLGKGLLLISFSLIKYRLAFSCLPEYCLKNPPIWILKQILALVETLFKHMHYANFKLSLFKFQFSFIILAFVHLVGTH